MASMLLCFFPPGWRPDGLCQERSLRLRQLLCRLQEMAQGAHSGQAHGNIECAVTTRAAHRLALIHSQLRLLCDMDLRKLRERQRT